MRALLLMFLALQDPPSFGKDERVVAAFWDAADRPASALRRDLEAMAQAGVQVALVPEAPAPLLEALAAIDKDRRARPHLGLRLTAERLKDPRAAEESIAAFVKAVPAGPRARVEGRLVVWVDAAPAPEALVSRQKPWVIGDGLSAAVRVGPGEEREEGKAYERSWAVAARPGPSWIVVDSWSAVCECAEHGKKYAEITRRSARAFREGEPVAMPRGKWTGAAKAMYTLEYNPNDQGLRPVKTPEGAFDTVPMAGVSVLTTREAKKGAPRQVGFDVDDSFCWWEKKSWRVTVEFLDTGEGAFRLEYDSSDAALDAAARAVKTAGEARFTGTGAWRRESFDLPDALFSNGQPGGSDFRIVVEKRGIALRLVAVARP